MKVTLMTPLQSTSARTTRRRPFARTLRVAAAGAALLLLAAVTRADEATDRLLDLVAEDAALCIEVPRLEENLAQLRQSEFVKRLKASALYKEWLAGDEAQRIAKARSSLERVTGKPFDQLTRELFGTALVVAVYKTNERGYAGVLITEADGEESLDAALEAWNRAEPQETTPRQHAGGTYFLRRRTAGDERAPQSLCYAKLGRIFALSDHEETIQRVLELSAQRGEAGQPAPRGDNAAALRTLRTFGPYLKARQSLSVTPFAAVYVNPRAWDSLFPNPDEAPRDQQAFGRLWRRMQTIALAVDLKRGFVVETVMHYDSAGLSPGWVRALNRMEGAPEFLKQIPENAVAVIAGRHDLLGFSQLVARQAEAADKVDQDEWESFRQVSRGLLLGRDLFDDVLPALQPNWGGYAVPRPPKGPDDAAAIPVDGLVAVEFTADSPAPADRSSLRDALDNGLNTALNLLAAYNNSTASRKPAIVRTEQQTGQVIRWIEGLSLFPYEPAYGLSGGHLAFASSPRVLRAFLEGAPNDGAIRQPRLERALRDYFPEANQVMFVDVAALRSLLKERREHLVRSAAAASELPPDDCERRIERLMDVGALADSAFIAGRITGDHMRLVVGGVIDEESAPAAP